MPRVVIFQSDADLEFLTNLLMYKLNASDPDMNYAAANRCYEAIKASRPLQPF